MFQQRLILHSVAIIGVLAAAIVMQLVASLYLVHRDGIRWSVEQLTSCELELPAELRAVLEEERRAEIVPDTVTRLIADLDFAQRSGVARATQRLIWLWLVPQAMEPEQLLGLYVRSWPHPEARGLCDVALIHLRRPLHDLTPGELRQLLAHEVRED